MWPSKHPTYKQRYGEACRVFSGVTRRRRKGMRGFVTSRADYLVRQQLRPPGCSAFPSRHPAPRVLAGGNTPAQSASRIHEAPHSSIRVSFFTGTRYSSIPVKCISKIRNLLYYSEFSWIFKDPLVDRIFALSYLFSFGVLDHWFDWNIPNSRFFVTSIF